MKKILSLLLVSILGLCCLAQQTPNHEGGDIVAIKGLESALNTGNAKVYASVFGKNATWDGPLGENAIGQDNIERAANLMFRRFGPLLLVQFGWRPLSPGIRMVDMYQKVKNTRSARNIATAPGSIAAPYGSDIRTTLVLKKQNERWTVIAARVADLRLSKAGTTRASISR
jgi:hypothetical protein